MYTNVYVRVPYLLYVKLNLIRHISYITFFFSVKVKIFNDMLNKIEQVIESLFIIIVRLKGIRRRRRRRDGYRSYLKRKLI